MTDQIINQSMTHTYEITEAVIGLDYVDNKEMLHVTIQLFVDGEKSEIRRFGFDLETTEKAVRAELDRYVACLDQEAKQKVENAEYERRQEAAKETIDALIPKAEKPKAEKPKKGNKSK